MRVLYVGPSVRDTRPSARWYREPFGMETVRENFASSNWASDWEQRLTELGIAHSGIKDHLVTFRDPDNIQREFFWAKANLVASPPRRLRRLANEARVALDGPTHRASWCRRCQVCGSTNGKDAVTLDGRRCHHRHSSPTWEAAGRAGATGNHDRRPRLVGAAAVG
jgi:hypothetical protein